MIRSKIASRFLRVKTMPFLWALLILLHVWPGVVAPAHAQGSRKDDIVFNSRGIPLAGATVRVCAMPASGQPCTPVALIYSDAALTQALANPTTTDGLGNYFFYAAPGKYEIEISGPGITTKQLPNIILPNDPSSPSFSAVSAFSLNLTGNLTVNGNTSVIGNLASGTLNLTNQSTPPGAAGSGTVNLYTKTADKLLYYKDETGTETGPLGPGAQTNVANNWTAQQNFNANQRFKGPNPYVDITAYGARACNPNATPCLTGLTATTNSGQPTITISSASTFVNGDGVVIYGAGPAVTMSTPGAPTVTPSLAKMGTGTGIVVTGPAGSTTYNYKIIARDTGGGLTAASAVGTTTTGAASLGNVPVNISSCSRANDLVTCTTSSAHGLIAGAEVYVASGNNLSDAGFYGNQIVVSVPDSTHFTYYTGLDTRNGAPTSASGGQAIWYSANHLTWASVAGAWEYFVCSDRANPGTYAVIGRSMPEGTNTDFTFDDFGSPFMDNQTFPPYITASICTAGSPTNDMLATTIVSGAGTTSLTLAANAGASLSGATIRLDAGAGLLAAWTAANANGSSVYIPIDASANSFEVNSFVDARGLTNANVMQAGTIVANETIAFQSNWFGDRQETSSAIVGAGGWKGCPVITTTGPAHPALYNSLQFGVVLQCVSIGTSQGTNGVLGALYEGGFNMRFIDGQFTTASGNNDYMGIGLYLRGNAGQTATNVILDTINFAPGGPVSNSGSHTPAFYCNTCGNGMIRSSYYVHRGAIIKAAGNWRIDQTYINGGSTPLYSFADSTTTNGWSVQFGTITLDTIAEPCLFGSSTGAGVIFTGPVCSPSFAGPPIGAVAAVTGNRVPVSGVAALGANPNTNNFYSNQAITQALGAWDGTLNSASGNGGPPYNFYAFNGALLTGKSFPIFVNGAVPAQPTCSVSAGGSVPAGTYQFVVVPQWQNNGEGIYSPNSAACTTTSGNQTVTINWTAVPGNPSGYWVYECASNGTSCTGGYAANSSIGGSQPQSSSATSAVWSTSSSPARVSVGASPTGGPTMLMPGTQGIATPALTLAGSAINPPPSGFTATRNISFPDNSGVIPVSSYQNSAYDNATRANGAIGSNWTVTNNGINISSNNFVGTASTNDVAFWSANSFSPVQFSQATITALNGTTDFPGVAVLLSGSGASTQGYECVEDSTNIFIQKISGTSNTTLTSAATTGAAGDILRLEVAPAGALTCFKNAVSTLTATDTTYTSGAPGLFLFGTVATSKNWSGGNLHPLAQLDTEQDWTKTQHFTQGIALGGAASESFNNNPRSEQNVFLPGALTSTWTGSTWTTDKAVTITRVQVQAKTPPSGCTTNAVVRLTDGTTPVNVTISAASNDSGVISQSYAAGASLTVAVQTAAAGCTTSPADANVTVQYRMQ